MLRGKDGSRTRSEPDKSHIFLWFCGKDTDINWNDKGITSFFSF